MTNQRALLFALNERLGSAQNNNVPSSGTRNVDVPFDMLVAESTKNRVCHKSFPKQILLDDLPWRREMLR